MLNKIGAKSEERNERVAKEGVITSVIRDKIGAMVELNCETDFVARNINFVSLVNDVAKAVVDQVPNDLFELSQIVYEENKTFDDVRKELFGKLGENIVFRRFKYIESKHSLTSYVHNQKIGVLVEYEGDAVVAKDIAMHISAYHQETASLMNQPFVKDDTKTVEQYLNENNAQLLDFFVYILGES